MRDPIQLDMEELQTALASDTARLDAALARHDHDEATDLAWVVGEIRAELARRQEVAR